MKNLFKYSLLGILVISLSWSCQQNDSLSVASATDTGVGGSYARFLVLDDFMYVVNRSELKTFDVSNPAEPTQIHHQSVGQNIETIFNFKNRLFIGSSSAMFIYTIPETDAIPVRTSEVSYADFFIDACDPIVANDSVAYVTLSTVEAIGRCRRINTIQINELKVFDVTDIENPFEIARYEMNHPKGVGLDGNTLFVCDDTHGLKVFDASDPLNLQLLAHFDDFTAFDVIPLGGLLLVVGPDNVYQFDYRDLNNIVKISEIPIEA